jgi:hypothetical protein
MLLQYVGLDTVGDEDDDYMEAEGMEVEYNLASDASAEHFQEADNVEEEVEIKVGYAEKRSRLWIHHKYASDNGTIKWLSTARECRPATRADAMGAPGPWDI